MNRTYCEQMFQMENVSIKNICSPNFKDYKNPEKFILEIQEKEKGGTS